MQLAASDKAFKIHFTKTLDVEKAKEYCALAGKRFLRNKYKELKLDILYILSGFTGLTAEMW